MTSLLDAPTGSPTVGPAVPYASVAALARLSRHACCPPECALGAVTAALLYRTAGDEPYQRIGVELRQDGRPHRHSYDLSRPVSLRGLLAQRGAAPVDGPWLPLTVRTDPAGLAVGADPGVGSLDRLPQLVAAALDDPDRPVDGLSLLDAAERDQVLFGWNGTDRDYPLDVTPPELVDRQARATPHSLAVRAADGELSYAELAARVDRLAALLARLGVGPGSLVGLHLGRGAGQLVALLAVWRAGGGYVPLDPAYPAERLRFMVEDSGLRLVLTERRHAGRCPAGGRPVLVVDGDLDLLLVPGPHRADAVAAPTDLAYVIYTSGSTGRPKGVEVEHRSLANLLHAMVELTGLDGGDGLLSVTSLSFDIAVLELLAPLVVGGRLVIADEDQCRDGRLLADLLHESGATVVQATPTTWQLLLAASPRLPPVTALCGGEPMPPALARALAGSVRVLWNVYGPTETTVWSAAARIGPADLDRPPVGTPLANTRAYILTGHLEPVPVGGVGELYLGGAGVARGYLNRPELTAERFRPDPFRAGERVYRTGDLARHRPDGAIELLGRRDDQVKIAGHRVELGEVETVLGGLPGVWRAVAAVRDGELVAFVQADATTTGERLRAELARRLPDHLVPVRVDCRDSFPLLPNGKVDRAALPATAPPDPAPAAPAAPIQAVPNPVTPAPAAPAPAARAAARDEEGDPRLVAAVGALWREILGVGEVGPADDFFGLGGTSLRAGQLVTRLERLTGEIVYVRAVFDAPTLAGFCAYLAAEYPALAARLGRPDPPPAAPGRADRRVDAAMREEFRRIVTGPAPRARSARRLGPAAFILSAPRSGSTLLRVMLGGHPDLFAPPELELLGFETMAGRAAGLAGGTASLGDGLAHALTELERLTPDQAHDVLRAAGDEPVGLLYERIQHRLGGRLLVEKTSTYATDAAALRRAELLFDEPRYLHLVRHPAAMIRSYQQVRLDQVFRHRHPFTGRELAELTWQTATDNVARLLAGLPPHRHLTVRFEDLLADPERTLTRITGFLGVPFDPVLLEPYDGRRDRMSGGLHPESRMAGDPRFHQHTDLDRGVADAWRTTFDLGSLSTVTTTLARRYGYHEAPPTGGRTDPLSAHQRGIYLHQTVSGERSLYNICKAWRLRGPLDELALRTALQSLVDRHEALRTTITVTDGEPRQHVLAGCDVPVEVVVLPAGATDEAVRNRLEELAATRLDLESGPGLRILLIRIGDRDHVLGLLVHHALVDGSSLAIVLAELAPAYRAALAGAPLELPAPVGAADVRDTWDALTNRRAGADLAYWRETLDGLPPLLPLPTDRPRPSRKSYRGARVPIAFDGDGWQQARRLARGEGATLFIVLLAVFQGLLRRYTQPSDTDRIVVGTAFVNRQGFEDRDAVGMFTSTLPLCTAIPDDPTFRELLARVRDSCLDAFEHPGVPLEDLVRELNLERDPSYSPLVQVLFTSEPPQAQELRLPGLDVTRLDVDWRTSKFDLTVSLISGADALGGWWEYDADLFDADQVRRMTGHFLALLRQAAADPDRPLSGYDLLAPDERHQLVHGWNPAGAPAGAAPAEPVEALIRRWARERPDAVAVTGGGRQLGYGRLDAASDDIAVRLLGAGVGPNDIVAVLCERSPAFVAALLGVLKSGAGYLPIDPGTPAARVEYLLRDSGSRAVVVDPAWTGAAAEDLPRVTVDLDAVPEAAVVRKRDVEDGDLAYVIYTSGSTGQPKGVLVEHRSLRNFVGWFTAEHRLGPDDRCTQTVNVGFDACVMEVWPTLAAGAALHIAPTATLTDPPAMWRWQRDAGATVSFLVTPLLEAMLAEPLPAGLALRTVVTGGDQLHAQPALREAPFRLVNGYGPTENTILSTTAEVDPDDPRLPSIGRPVPGSTAYLLDGAMGPVPVGVEGELYVGGSQVARGYLDLPELSARRFVPDPFAGDPDARLFRTGDRARRRADGRIDFVGRADHQVKIRGYRIELGEIEAALRQLPGIREAVVVATGSGNDRRLDAFVLGDAPPAPDALRDALRRRLPGYMVPTTVTALDALPLTSNGKVDRRALAGRVGAAPRAAAAATPANPLEAELLDLWRRVLGDDRIGVTDSFFDVGGHSLNAMRLTSLIRDRTGRQVTLSALFTAPTVRDLARTLADDHEGAAPAGHLVELGGAGGSAPLCCVHASDGSVLPYAPFAGICGADRPVWGLRAEPVPDAGHGSVEDMAASYVEELRRRHPAGPVHLLGWSFGGLLAYEMARQLTAAGEAPGRLILLDSEPLTGPDGPEHDPELLAEFSRQLRRRSGAPTAGAVPGDWAGLVRAARAAGWVDAEVDDRELRRAYDTFRGHVALGRRYVPPALAHPLTVFVATDRDPALRAAQVAAWQRLGTAGVTVTELAGDHFDAVSEQALRLVARALPAPRQPSGRQTNGKDLTGW